MRRSATACNRASALHPLLLAIDSGFDPGWKRADISASPRRKRRRRPPSPSGPPATGRAATAHRAPCADLSNLVVTARKASAASRYCWRWKKLSPSQYCESADQRIVRDISARNCAWSLRPAHNPCAAYSRCRDRTRPSAMADGGNVVRRTPAPGACGGGGSAALSGWCFRC